MLCMIITSLLIVVSRGCDELSGAPTRIDHLFPHSRFAFSPSGPHQAYQPPGGEMGKDRKRQIATNKSWHVVRIRTVVHH